MTDWSPALSMGMVFKEGESRELDAEGGGEGQWSKTHGREEGQKIVLCSQVGS